MEFSVDIAKSENVKEAWFRFLFFNMVDPITAKEEFRKYLRMQRKEDIKHGLKNNDDKLLEWMIEYLGLPTEDYEICQAIKEIITERP